MTCSTSWKSIQEQLSCFRSRYGETSLAYRGHRAWHIWREVTGTRETHTGSFLFGVMGRALLYNRKGGNEAAVWESDSSIVLGDRESLLQGEGMDEHA